MVDKFTVVGDKVQLPLLSLIKPTPTECNMKKHESTGNTEQELVLERYKLIS